MLRYCKNCGLLLPHDARPLPPRAVPRPRWPVRPAAQPGPAAPLYGTPDDREAEPTAEAMSQGATTGTMILFAIPVVGFILALVWSFGGTHNEARKRLALVQVCPHAGRGQLRRCWCWWPRWCSAPWRTASSPTSSPSSTTAEETP